MAIPLVTRFEFLAEDVSGVYLAEMRWDRFDEAGKALSCNQKDIAGVLNVKANKISRWKSGRVVFRVTDLLAVAKILQVSPGWLLGEDRAEDALTEMDRVVLGLVRRMGHPEALARLSLIDPESGGAGVGRAQPRDPSTGGPIGPTDKRRSG